MPYKNWDCRIHHRHQEGAVWKLKNDPNKDSPATYTEKAKATYGYVSGEFYTSLLALDWAHKKRWDGSNVYSLKHKKGGNSQTTNYMGAKVQVDADGTISIPVASILYFAQTGKMDAAYIAGHAMARQQVMRKQNQRKRMSFWKRDTTLTSGGIIYNFNVNMKQLSVTGTAWTGNQGQNFFEGTTIYPESLKVTAVFNVSSPVSAYTTTSDGVNFLRFIVFQWTKPTLVPNTGSAALPTAADVLEYLNPTTPEWWQVISPLNFENLPYLTIHYDETIDLCFSGMTSLIAATSVSGLQKAVKTWRDTGLRKVEFLNSTATSSATVTVPQCGGFYALVIESHNYTSVTVQISADVIFRDAAGG